MEKCPIEIWVKIFSYFIDYNKDLPNYSHSSSSRNYKSLLQISSVCKYWRQIVKETPKLHNQLRYVIKGSGQMNEFIKAMNEIPKDLRLNPHKIHFIRIDDESIENFMSNLKLDSLRTMYFDMLWINFSTENLVKMIEMSKLTLKTIGIFNHQCQLDLSLLFKALENIEILHWFRNTTHLKSISNLKNLKKLYFDDKEPLDVSNSSLQSLTTKGGNLCLYEKTFASNLIHLDIEGFIPTEMDVGLLVSFICHNCTKLEHLQLTNTQMDGSEFVPDTLDRLKELKLGFHHSVPSITFQNLKFHNLQTLEVKVNGIQSKLKDIHDIHVLGNHNPNLKHVYLYNFRLDKDQILFEKTFGNMKNIESIKFDLTEDAICDILTRNTIIDLVTSNNCTKLQRIEIVNRGMFLRPQFYQQIVEEFKCKKPNLIVVITFEN